MAAYGDFSKFHARLRTALYHAGVNLHDVPGGAKDAADKAMMADIFLFALDHRPPADIFVISGDVDFANSLSKLGARGYKILLAVPSDNVVSSSLTGAGDLICDWYSLAAGLGVRPARNLLSRPVYDINPSRLPHQMAPRHYHRRRANTAFPLPPNVLPDPHGISAPVSEAEAGGPPKEVANTGFPFVDCQLAPIPSQVVGLASSPLERKAGRSTGEDSSFQKQPASTGPVSISTPPSEGQATSPHGVHPGSQPSVTGPAELAVSTQKERALGDEQAELAPASPDPGSSPNGSAREQTPDIDIVGFSPRQQTHDINILGFSLIERTSDIDIEGLSLDDRLDAVSSSEDFSTPEHGAVDVGAECAASRSLSRGRGEESAEKGLEEAAPRQPAISCEPGSLPEASQRDRVAFRFSRANRLASSRTGAGGCGENVFSTSASRDEDEHVGLKDRLVALLSSHGGKMAVSVLLQKYRIKYSQPLVAGAYGVDDALHLLRRLKDIVDVKWAGRQPMVKLKAGLVWQEKDKEKTVEDCDGPSSTTGVSQKTGKLETSTIGWKEKGMKECVERAGRREEVTARGPSAGPAAAFVSACWHSTMEPPAESEEGLNLQRSEGSLKEPSRNNGGVIHPWSESKRQLYSVNATSVGPEVMKVPNYVDSRTSSTPSEGLLVPGNAIEEHKSESVGGALRRTSRWDVVPQQKRVPQDDGRKPNTAGKGRESGDLLELRDEIQELLLSYGGVIAFPTLMEAYSLKYGKKLALGPTCVTTDKFAELLNNIAELLPGSTSGTDNSNVVLRLRTL